MEAGGRGKGKINSNQQDPHLARCGGREINNTLSPALGGLRKLPSQSPNITLAPQTFVFFWQGVGGEGGVGWWLTEPGQQLSCLCISKSSDKYDDGLPCHAR